MALPPTAIGERELEVIPSGRMYQIREQIVPMVMRSSVDAATIDAHQCDECGNIVHSTDLFRAQIVPLEGC
eukprot:scaffold5244_cov91-Cylindrotheca_fusiformis.AAC.1